MGGRNSEVTDSTTDLFLEVATSTRHGFRSARRALGLSTDASYRFERGVDVELGQKALERVAQIIVRLAGGAIDSAPIDLHGAIPPAVRIPLRPSRVSRVLGEGMTGNEIGPLLEAPSGSACLDRRRRRGGGPGDGAWNWPGVFRRTPTSFEEGDRLPSWRGDVVEEVDLIEEVARLRGFRHLLGHAATIPRRRGS